ncbi:hypothetical protein DENSPDRAFT_841038 [Dentipellis sp. KUC8613]|nr:hypothetical protein DENSPDRAFT_841038 [Dentipellis sp. KUC8613]
MSQETEEDSVNLLISMMGGDLDPERAKAVLRKHNGDLQKAATTILEETTDSDPIWDGAGLITLPEQGTISQPRTPPPSKPVPLPGASIETEEDKELKEALEASLQPQPTLQPSNRAPDPNWAVVSSNIEAPPGVSQEDQTLNRVIQESLNTTYNDYAMDAFEELPLEKRVRYDGRPVALRPTQATLAYAGLILQGLFFVPQVRETFANWRPSTAEAEDGYILPPVEGPEHMVWTLVELFTNMDIAALSELNVDDALKAFGIDPPLHATESPGDISCQLLSSLAWVAETVLYGDIASVSHHWPRLFHFRYGPADAELNTGPFDKRIDTSVVKVDVRGDDKRNDLMSSLSAQLSENDVSSKQQVIFEPSDVVSFQLVRHEVLPSYSGGQSPPKQRFKYPKHIYLDQFMKENVGLANAKRAKQREIEEEIRSLTLRKNALTHANNKDILKDLRSSLHYFENIANREDPERKATVEGMSMKLRKMLTRIENEIETIESQIAKLQIQSAQQFDGPELREHRYDLRVVLVHDGLFGRNHMYSYVQQGSTWWKTVDYEVTEVSEEAVLNDPVGLHLGAGPYLLIYSRAVPEFESKSLPWPEDVKNSVKHNNHMFLSALPEAITSQLQGQSPPSSTHPSEWDTPSSSVELPSSPRIEPMDVSV